MNHKKRGSKAKGRQRYGKAFHWKGWLERRVAVRQVKVCSCTQRGSEVPPGVKVNLKRARLALLASAIGRVVRFAVGAMQSLVCFGSSV